MSTLTAFPYIAEGSDATPGLFNRMFSQLSDNIRTVDTSVISDTHYSGVSITVPSSTSDYLYLQDSLGQKSNYIIGSHVGSTADGLNIWDASGNTMIASFSKQSIRFWQQVVGPVFDIGGALANTLNVGTFGTAADSKESRIQAAILAAALSSISNVYLPASFYPYSASSVSFIDSVHMVREGGSDWPAFDVRSYGAAGTGTADDTFAITSAASALQANGKGRLLFPNGTYKITSVASQVACNFTNLNGVIIDFGESLINDVYTYTGLQQATLFKFTACQNITIKGRVQSQSAVSTNPAATFARGLWVAEFYQGCNNIIADLDVTGCLGALRPTKIFSDPSTYISRLIKGRIKASQTYYPYVAQFSGDDADLTIDSDTCGRSFYIYGVSNQRLYVRAKNQQVTTLIWGFSGFGCRNVDVTFIDTLSDTNQAAARMQLGWGDSTPVTHANIKIRLDTNNPAGSPWGNTFEFAKISDGGSTPDAVGRGHILDGFELTGISQQVGTLAHIGLLSGVWASPDVCRNFSVRNFTGLGANNPISLTSATPIGQLYDRAIFENVNCGHNIYAYNGSNGEVVFLACRALNFSAVNTDTDIHTLIDCNATDGTNQATTNVNFIQTLVGGVVTNTLLGPVKMSSTATIGGLATLTGGAIIASTATLNGGAQIGGGAFGVGRIYLNAGSGTVFVGTTGTNNDMTFLTPGGSSVLAMPTGTGDLYMPAGGLAVVTKFQGPAGSAINPMLNFSSESSLGVYRSGVSTVALSYGTFNLATQGVRLSMRTLAASAVTVSAAKTNVAVDEVVFTIGGASGASICIMSGGTLHYFNSAGSAKQT